MARKVTKAGGAPAAPKGAAGVNDVEILSPDQEITIDGRVVLVREYRFFEGLKLRARARPFFDDLYSLFVLAGPAPSFDDVSDLLGEHEAAVVDMVALSTGCEPEWIRGLDDQDGDTLLVTWWLVNAGFFIRRVMRRAAQERLASASQSAGPASSTLLSQPDTSVPPTTSEPSPPAR